MGGPIIWAKTADEIVEQAKRDIKNPQQSVSWKDKCKHFILFCWKTKKLHCKHCGKIL